MSNKRLYKSTVNCMLSDRVMTVPELTGEASQLYAREGFNIIATANTRDRGVNEMSAALKRRFDFETVFPIMDSPGSKSCRDDLLNKQIAKNRSVYSIYTWQRCHYLRRSTSKCSSRNLSSLRLG